MKIKFFFSKKKFVEQKKKKKMKIIAYIKYDVEDYNTVRGIGGLLLGIGGFLFLLSILAKGVFQHGMDTVKFLLVFLSACFIMMIGLIMIFKAKVIANKTKSNFESSNKKWRVFMYTMIGNLFFLLGLFTEVLINCFQCIAWTFVALIIYIIILLGILAIYIWKFQKGMLLKNTSLFIDEKNPKLDIQNTIVNGNTPIIQIDTPISWEMSDEDFARRMKEEIDPENETTENDQ